MLTLKDTRLEFEAVHYVQEILVNPPIEMNVLQKLNASKWCFKISETALKSAQNKTLRSIKF